MGNTALYLNRLLINADMMNKSIFSLVGALTALLFVACSDDSLWDSVANEQAPADRYVGDVRIVLLERGFDGFDIRDVVLYLKTADNELIRREGRCLRNGTTGAKLALDHGLKDGRYELLYLEYALPADEVVEGVEKGHYGIGCRVLVENGRVEVLDCWNDAWRLYGAGTAEDPYRISSEEHLIKLCVEVGEARIDEDWSNAHFLQTADLDGRILSLVSRTYGWIPIGFQHTQPFRSVYDGGGHTIDRLEVKREAVSGVGLFGYVLGAYIKNVHLTNCVFTGDFAVGGIAGAVVSDGGERSMTVIENCSVQESSIRGKEGGVGVGGLLGAVDQYTIVNVHNCKSLDNTVYAGMSAGGVIGMAANTSALMVGMCENSSDVTSDWGSAGGVIGACDSLNMANCQNFGSVTGAVKYVKGDEERGYPYVGAGGLVGGARAAYIVTSINHGTIQGRTGVGGVLGSSRVMGGLEGEDYICQDVTMLYCGNTGAVGGESCVGGLCGEAQLGSSGCYNAGSVTASGSYAGGIVGYAQVALMQNNVNSALVIADSHAAGMAGVALMGRLTINQNYGQIQVNNGHGAGMIGHAGRDMLMNYCSNFGTIQGASEDPLAGLIAECGDYAEESGISDEAKYTMASIEIALAFAGVVGAGLAFAKPVSAAVKAGITGFSVTSWLASTACLLYDTLMFQYDDRRLGELEDLGDLSEETQRKIEESMQQVKQTQRYMRTMMYTPSMTNFSSNMLSFEYPTNVQSLVDFCLASEDNEKAFNEMTELERAEYITETIEFEANKARDHQIASAVSIFFSSVAFVAGGVALVVGSGGTAAPAVIAGAAGFFSGVIGGLNTIVQTATANDYNFSLQTENVNAAPVVCSVPNRYAGGLVGMLHDHGAIEDCINIGDGPGSGGHLVGDMHDHTTLKNSLSIATTHSWGDIVASSGDHQTVSGLYFCVGEDQSAALPEGFDTCSAVGLTIAEVGDRSKYSGWDISGEQSAWIIPSHVKTPFPIPYVSRYIPR